MMVLSPSWFPNNLGWPPILEEYEMAPDLNPWTHYGSRESDLPRFSSCPGLEADSGDSGPSRSCGDLGDPTKAKKLNHNANERDRRKRLNILYSSLRSLLPTKDHHSKKLSIPNTVSLVLKYIPELQKEVEWLTRRKEDLLSKMSNTSSHEQQGQHGRFGRRGPMMVSSYPTIVATQVDEREVVVQICSLATGSCPLSKLLLLLEKDGFQVVNASGAFAALGDKVFYNLHLQAKEALDMECGMLSEKLVSAYGHS